MKRFLTCALCFVSLPAIAVTLYYEQDGACPGLYSSQPLGGCGASTVAKLNVTPINGTVFNGFFINGQKVVNADGTFTNNALDILRGADLTSGAEIPQTYTCSNGVTETGYGECQSGTPLVTVKLDTRGGSMAAPTQVKVAHGGTLTAYAPDRSSFDGAIFVGWAKSGQPDSSAAKNAVVNDTVGTTVTYRAVYSCPDGYYMNQYNVCVSDGDDYFDDRGNNIPAGNLQCWRPTGPNGTYENYCHWNVKITFHNNNQGFSLTSGTQNDGMVLTCYGGRGCGKNSLCASNNSSETCTHLYQPKANDYWFRGYFRLNDKEVQNPSIVIVEENNDRAAYNNFYPKTMMGNTMSITGHAVVAMSDSIVELDCRPFGPGTTGNWITNPDGTTYCDGMVTDTNQFSLDVYGGWARKCVQSATTNCNETIGDAYYANQGFLKGRVRYDTSCADGYTISGGNSTYDPQCVKEAGSTLDLTYQFVDQYGLTVNGCNTGAYESCTTSDTYYLPHQAVCGSNNPLKYLSTYSGLYTPNRPVTCGSSVFGTSPATRVVTGYVCRYSCTPGFVQNGRCVESHRTGGTVNGNEYVENLFAGCYQLQCNSGYKATFTGNSWECVLQQ